MKGQCGAKRKYEGSVTWTHRETDLRKRRGNESLGCNSDRVDVDENLRIS